MRTNDEFDARDRCKEFIKRSCKFISIQEKFISIESPLCGTRLKRSPDDSKFNAEILGDQMISKEIIGCDQKSGF